MKEFLVKKKRIIVTIILAAIITASLGRIAYLCAYVKEGVHSDEVWSYGLANGYREPYIYTNYEQNEQKYMNKWITGNTLKEYLTVQKGERFDYASVLYNLKSDNHPPFYFFILHTICSFFPDTYSRWFGYSINFVVFVILMAYLYLLAAKLSRSRLTGLIVAAAYGFSVSGIDTFIFIRHYAMVAMFVIMTIYHSMKLMESCDRRQYIKRLIGLFFIITMGCLTHYEFVPFLAAYGICMLIYYIARKKWYEMFTYGGACAACAVVLLLATGILTRLIMRITGTDFDGTSNGGSSDDGQTFIQDVYANIKMTIEDATGAKLSDMGVTILLIAIGVILALTVGYFIYRHTKVKKGLKEPLFKEAMSVNTFTWISLTVALLAFLAFVSGTASQKNMGVYANRYMFPVYPLFTLIIVCVVRWILLFVAKVIFAKLCPSKILIRNIITAVVSVVLVTLYLINNNKKTEIIYLFPRDVDNGIYMEDVTKGKDVLLFIKDNWLLTTYTDLLMDADDIYVGHSVSLEEMKKADLGGHKVDYLVFDATKFYYDSSLYYKVKTEFGRRHNIEQKCMPTIEGLTGQKFEFLDSDWVFTRRVYVYKAVEEE